MSYALPFQELASRGIQADNAFDQLLMQVNAVLDACPNAYELTAKLRDVLRTAMARPGFTAACAMRAADALDPSPDLGKARTRFPTIHRDDGRALRIRLFAWAPNRAHPPHRHGHWTVTGVLHRRLVFRVYQDGADGSHGASHKQIDAGPGDVGMICTPCWHDVSNPGDAPALSIHLFHRPTDEAGAAAPAATTVDIGESPAARDRILALCAEAIGAGASVVPDAVDSDRLLLLAALDRMQALGGPLAQREVAHALATLANHSASSP